MKLCEQRESDGRSVDANRLARRSRCKRRPRRIDFHFDRGRETTDRKSTRLNSSHSQISYAVFCLKKKKKKKKTNKTKKKRPKTTSKNIYRRTTKNGSKQHHYTHKNITHRHSYIDAMTNT